LEKYFAHVNVRIASWTYFSVEGLDASMLENGDVPFSKDKKVFKELSDITVAAISLIKN